MKKFIAIPLLFLYLTAISGAMVQLHFCGSKLISWSVNKHEKTFCCAAPGDDKDVPGIQANSCCSDKTFTLKLPAEQSNIAGNAIQLLSLAGTAVFELPIPPVYSFYTNTSVPTAHRAHAPPGLWQNIPLYKLHSSFTYYG